MILDQKSKTIETIGKGEEVIIKKTKEKWDKEVGLINQKAQQNRWQDKTRTEGHE
jgi:hypothetical protein